MKQEPSLDHLAEFYAALDTIPTPPIRAKRQTFLGALSFALAPIAAALLASGFILFCTLGPADSGSASGVQIPMDHFAIEEMKSTAPEVTAGTHTERLAPLGRHA